jgi:hypothetical protein
MKSQGEWFVWLGDVPVFMEGDGMLFNFSQREISETWQEMAGNHSDIQRELRR